MRIFKSVWLENNWDASEAMIENFVEMGVSCITYTADSGDINLEIAAEEGEIEKICSELISCKVIDASESDFMVDNKIDIIVLY